MIILIKESLMIAYVAQQTKDKKGYSVYKMVIVGHLKLLMRQTRRLSLWRTNQKPLNSSI